MGAQTVLETPHERTTREVENLVKFGPAVLA